MQSAADDMNTEAWHCLSVTQCAQHLKTSLEDGLSEEDASRRLASAGPNVIEGGRQRSPWKMLGAQFADVLIVILMVAAVISGFVGEAVDTAAILIIVVLNAVFGFVQEFRVERALAALRDMASPEATVLRGGQRLKIAAEDLVLGDYVLLEAGQIVPADLRLIELAQLRVDEAPLTGESESIDKSLTALSDAALPVPARSNMVFKGTLIVKGRGAGLVAASGMETQLGQVASLLASAERVATPLQKRLSQLGKRLAVAVLLICLLVFAVGVYRGEDPLLMFLTAVSLAVAAVPEALPAVVTIALALGARNMVRHKALVRRLPAVETLGSVTFICTDKTGTLTENRMHVEQFLLGSAPQGELDLTQELDRHLAEALVLNNDAHTHADCRDSGEPTELALLQAARRAGLDPLVVHERYPRQSEIPFDAHRRRMLTVHRCEQGALVLIKGAPESVIPLCAGDSLDSWMVHAEKLARQGLRVLAVARGVVTHVPADLQQLEHGLSLLGLVAMIDPPRAEVPAAVRQAFQAGIRPVMITGDHPSTAMAIARRLGIADAQSGVLSGRELAALDDAAFSQKVREIRVYARMSPAQKIRIVKALQSAGEFVAMTGDGVNDGPALKTADIGVAMGRGGTDVAREAASLVLLDDNFATIVRAVRAGRRVFDNIRKFVQYTLTSNSGEIWVLFLAPLMGLPIPLMPIHILWINLMTDGLPGLALAVEPEEKGIMSRPPRPPKESIFSNGLGAHIVIVGLLMGMVTIAGQAWAYYGGHAAWQTIVFTILVWSQMGNALAVRSDTRSVFEQGLLSNPYLLAAVLSVLGLQMLVIYHPAMNVIFKTQPLTTMELAVCALFSSVVFATIEVAKAVRR